MKKLVVVAAILALSGTAFAVSLNIPWFLDRGANDGAYPPAALEKTFITVKNTTGSDITVEVEYRLPDGSLNNSWTETDLNTFVLKANSSIAWRPQGVEAGTEGADGLLVPNCTAGAATAKGACKLTWPAGAVTDVQGRVIEVQLNKMYGYLLPPAVL